MMVVLAVQSHWSIGFFHPITLMRRRDLLDVSSSIIVINPWTDLFVVEQDGVHFGKSLHYASGTLHWYANNYLGEDIEERCMCIS